MSSGDIVLDPDALTAAFERAGKRVGVGNALIPAAIRAYLNALPDEWQPIETADRSGDDVILWDGGFCVGHFVDYGDEDSHWAARGEFGRTEVSPTHWRPLPPAPRSEAE